MYVDDILLAANDLCILRETKTFSMNFEIKDMGETSYVIGIKIFCNRSQGLVRLSQKGHIERVLERFNMNNCSVEIVPIQKKKKDKLNFMQCPKNDVEWKKTKSIP